ncbi:MAG TPA: NADH-quinone oxidoreductase subunit M, partial [Pirellulales bacterium]|nr:NADH-quinone oxidoreductase subunit M [Pirellulales bacterium]
MTLLSLIVFVPTAAALAIAFFPREKTEAMKMFSLAATAVVFVLTAIMALPGRGDWQFDTAVSEMQKIFSISWIPSFNIRYFMGVDGISFPLVLLTSFVTMLSMAASWPIQKHVKAYCILFLLLETGMLGVFMSLDLVLFFLFWEVGLIPMYFLINIWGSANRQYASFKFFIYTMAGSVGLLLAIQTIGLSLGTFDMTQAFARWPTWADSIYGIPAGTVRAVAFWAFSLAFAIKVPIWPFHTWLPDAHTEAPTAGSMLLAGVLLKLGAYGFLRLVLPLYPAEAHQYAGVLALLALMAIVMGALASFGQTDFKRLVAYSSINHMGFVVLGIAVAAYVAGSPIESLRATGIMAINGAVLQMFAHGLSAAGMFLLVGVIYDRTHTRNLQEFGG